VREEVEFCLFSKAKEDFYGRPSCSRVWSRTSLNYGQNGTNPCWASGTEPDGSGACEQQPGVIGLPGSERVPR